MQNLLKVIIMVNEHKAHASFVLRIINTFISFWIALILVLIVYSIFFEIDNSLLIAGILIPTPFIWMIILCSIGLALKEMEHLSKYEKYKLWCEFVRDTTITALTTLLGTLSTIIFYQLQKPIALSKFIALIIGFLVSGFLIVALLVYLYCKILRNLKSIKN